MSNKRFFGSLLAVSLCLATGFVACGGAAANDDDGGEASAAMSQSGAVEYMLTSPINSADAATAASALAAAQWWPAGCATRQKDPTQPIVTITLNNCSGPFGLLKWNGTLTATFAKNPDGTLNVKAASTNMTVNGNPATFTMDRNITVSGTGTTRDVKGSTTWTRTNANGVQVTHSNQWTATVDSATKCRTVNGTGATTAGTVSIATTTKDYKVCRPNGVDGCPSGMLTHVATPSNATVMVMFDGTNTATVTGPNGTRQVNLICQ
jgi:hypothetical protein